MVFAFRTYLSDEERRNSILTTSSGLAYLPGQYVQAFRAYPSEPLYNLCIGLTFIHMASQKYVLKRHALTVQVMHLVLPAFLCAWK